MQGKTILTLTLCAAIAAGCATQTADSPAATETAWRAMRDGQFENALTLLESRMVLAPRDGRAAFLRAVALDRMGRSNAAADAFAAYARAGGRQPELDFEWGMSLLHAGRPTEAAQRLRPYLDANPTSARAMLALGQAQLALSRFDDAERLFRAAAADPAARAPALLRLAASQSGRGDNDAARVTLDSLSRKDRS